MEVIPPARMVDPPPTTAPDKPCSEEPLIHSSSAMAADLGHTSPSSSPESNFPSTMTGNVVLQSASMASKNRPQPLPLKAAVDNNFGQTFNSIGVTISSVASPPVSTATEDDPPLARPPLSPEQRAMTSIVNLEQQSPTPATAAVTGFIADKSVLENPNLASLLTETQTVPDPGSETASIPVNQSAMTTVTPASADIHVQAATQVAKSFKDVTAGNSKKSGNSQPLFGNTPALPGVSLIKLDGKDVLFFADDSTSQLADSLKWALVGKFSHTVPNIQSIGQFMAKLGLDGDFELKWLSSRQVLIVLKEELDFVRLWTNGLWQVGGSPMRLLKWTPLFNVNTECPVAPIWAKLPGLPAHLYERRALFQIANQLGKPVKADIATAQRTRASFARVCVEVDLQNPLTNNIVLGINGKLRDQPVVYENVPSYCSHCSHIGHKEGDCYIKNVALKPSLKMPESKHNMDKGKGNSTTVTTGDDKIDGKTLDIQGSKAVSPTKQNTSEKSVPENFGVDISNSFSALEREEGEIVLDSCEDHVPQLKDDEVIPRPVEHSVGVPVPPQCGLDPSGSFLVGSSSSSAPNRSKPSLKKNPTAKPTKTSHYPPKISAPFSPDRRLEQAASQSPLFYPQQLVPYTSPPTRPAAQHPLTTIYPPPTPPLLLHDVFIPDMDVAQVNYHQALDLVAEREYVCSDDDDDAYGNYYDSDDGFKEQALHRRCSTPDFKQRNKRGAFTSGYGGRITRSMAKFC